MSSTQSPAVPPRVATPVTQQQPRKARRWLAVAALLTLPTLGVGLFTATVGSTQLREAQAAGDRFIDVVTDHRYADAYDLTSSEFRRTTSSTRFSEMCDQYLTQAGAMGRFESAGGGFGAYTGGFRVQSRYLIHCQLHDVEVKLVLGKQDGQWLVQSSQFLVSMSDGTGPQPAHP